MSLKIKNAPQKAAIPPVPEDTYTAILVGICDLGHQLNTYNGQSRWEPQVRFTFELVDETVEIDGEVKPRVVGTKFRASLNERANMRKFIEGWRGKITDEQIDAGYDLKHLLGEAGLLSVGIKEKKDKTGSYNVVNGIMALPKKMEVPVTTSELLWFDIDEWDEEMLAKFPTFVQEEVRKSEEAQKNHPSTETIEVKDAEGACPI